MTPKLFTYLVGSIGIAFTIFFFVTVVPPLMQNFDIVGAFAAGFVNPYSSGYSTDVIACWLILAVWVIYERKTLNIRHGWICLVVGIVPGVAVGFAAYLILRLKQLAALNQSSA